MFPNLPFCMHKQVFLIYVGGEGILTEKRLNRNGQKRVLLQLARVQTRRCCKKDAVSTRCFNWNIVNWVIRVGWFMNWVRFSCLSSALNCLQFYSMIRFGNKLQFKSPVMISLSIAMAGLRQLSNIGQRPHDLKMLAAYKMSQLESYAISVGKLRPKDTR